MSSFPLPIFPPVSILFIGFVSLFQFTSKQDKMIKFIPIEALCSILFIEKVQFLFQFVFENTYDGFVGGFLAPLACGTYKSAWKIRTLDKLLFDQLMKMIYLPKHILSKQISNEWQTLISGGL